MLKSHEKFHSVNGKRLILIADDEAVNRAILGNILEEDYEILFAKDGEETLDLIRKNVQHLCLILLDLKMPGLSGFEILRILQQDAMLSRIPVMVMTAEKSAEAECLKLGANDFLSKPYSQPEVVLARVVKTIELSEDREIILSTERDPITDLYNREFFFSYADQYDQYHEGKEMDAIVVDINHFHMINERYGKEFGDQVLKQVSMKLREAVQGNGGIVCRREADTFLIYCPHRDNDYQEILDFVTSSIEATKEASSSISRLRLRMGVYQNCDRAIDIERRFDRAKLASDRIRHDYSASIAFYDKKLHDAQIFSERLLDDFPQALSEHQFKVFYQPKFDVRKAAPVLASAEALVRWIHPELGFVTPDVFIQLFEENGLIQQLDYYVWEEVAAQMQDWKKRFGITIPVSVNMSRVDMYDPFLSDRLRQLMEKYELKPEEYVLEITESAYTEDSSQIIETVNTLREMGFKIEMDDFGTGYSSLNMISTLPIDVLKIDMLFIRSAFDLQKDVRMIELIMEIADYLRVPVVAEGVETEEQTKVLKELGCDFVQGYFFSKPVPPEEFERFVEEKKRRMEEEAGESLTEEERYEHISVINIVRALAGDFERIYYVDLQTGHYTEFLMQGDYQDLHCRIVGKDFFGETLERIPKVVYPDDQERMAAAMNPAALLNELKLNHKFETDYRLMDDGVPAYHRLKAVFGEVEGTEKHIIVGISNIDSQKRKELDHA